MYNRVLVALDNSPLSKKVLDTAARLAKPGSEIFVLRVNPKTADLDDDCNDDLSHIETETTKTEWRLKSTFSHPTKVEVRSGPLVGTILTAATEWESDLIVLGTHGRKNLSENITGSPAERVASQATATVVIVKADGYPFLQD